MEVCNLIIEEAPFGVCNDCYTSVVFGYTQRARSYTDEPLNHLCHKWLMTVTQCYYIDII